MSMYSLRIEAQRRKAADLRADGDLSDDGDADSVYEAAELAETADSLEFTAGNPRVEHITGLVHLFRELPAAHDVQSLAAAASSAGGAAAHSPGGSWASAVKQGPKPALPSGLPESRGPVLCCLAIPADMSVADFCRFTGAYLQAMRSLRVLRREARQRVVCMVLIRFGTQEDADGFFYDFNCRAFSSLEPEIVCRLVWVRDVQILGPGNSERILSSYLTPPPHLSTAANVGHAGSTFAAAGSTVAGAQGTAAEPATAGCTTPQQQQVGRSGGGAQGASHQGGPDPVAGEHHTASTGGGGRATGGGALPVTELPTCPVCLERLDEHISGIVTTVCNHQFHSECLQQWGDTSCPVCRYCSQPHAHTSRCAECGVVEDLWICLICGHVGCGRYRAGHAADHWKTANHCYALELETQRVWDYAGDNYVHRLIRSKTDGKLVEVPSPGRSGRPRPRRHGRHAHGHRGGRDSACAEHGAGHHRHGVGQGASCDGDHEEGEEDEEWDRSESEGEGAELKEAMMASKLDHIAAEYNHLLASQLDSQRAYFEGLLEQQAAQAQDGMRAAAAAAAAAKEEVGRHAAALREADRKRQAMERKLADAQAIAAKAGEERDFLKSLSDNLLSNQKELRAQLDVVKGEVASRDAAIRDLQEQVRDLMVYIEASRTVEASGELAGATVLPVPAAPSSSSSGARKGAKGKGGR